VLYAPLWSVICFLKLRAIDGRHTARSITMTHAIKLGQELILAVPCRNRHVHGLKNDRTGLL
jgi:hypothetical protein